MKNTTNGSLSSLIVSKFGCDMDSDSFYTVFAHTLSYLTRGIDYSEFQSRLKPLCRDESFSAKDFRLHLHETEYLSLILRLFVLRLGKYRTITQSLARGFAKEYGVRISDAKRIYRFWKEQNRFRSRIRREAKSYNVDTHLNRQILSAALNEVMGPVTKYIKWYTYSKLRFICKSQNKDLMDLHTDLKIKVMEAFYKMMPSTMEPQHVINYLKRVVHNSGINIINANTSLKAGRLVNNDPTKNDSFSLLVVSENQMRISADSDPVSYEELAGHDPITKVEIEHSVNTIVSSIKKGGKKHKFLTILMGADDAEFTSWLQRNRYCSAGETNSDLQVRECPTKFNILLARFLRVTTDQVTRFLGRLRSSLEPVAAQAAMAA